MMTITRTAILAGLGLALCLPAVAANDDKDTKTDGKNVQRRVVVRTNDGDEPQVFEFNGDEIPRVKRGYLGIGLTDLTPELREHFGVPKDVGVLVARVEPDSPAAKAGIKVGDIITGLDGQKVDSASDITRAVRRRKDGDQVPLELFRDRKVRTITSGIVEKERPQIDLGELGDFNFDFKDLPRGDGHRYMIDAEKMKKMGEEMQKKFNSPEFKERIKRQVEEQQNLLQHQKDLEKQLQDMQKQINELQRRLNERSAVGTLTPRG